MKTYGYKDAAARAKFEKGAAPVRKGAARAAHIRLTNRAKRRSPTKALVVDNTEGSD